MLKAALLLAVIAFASLGQASNSKYFSLVLKKPIDTGMLRKALDLDNAETVKYVTSLGVKVLSYPGEKATQFPGIPQADESLKSKTDNPHGIAFYVSPAKGGPIILLKHDADRSALLHELLHHIFYLSLKNEKKNNVAALDKVKVEANGLAEKCEKDGPEACQKFYENIFDTFEVTRQLSVDRNFEEAAIELLLFQYVERGKYDIEINNEYAMKSLKLGIEDVEESTKTLQRILDEAKEAKLLNMAGILKINERMIKFRERSSQILNEAQGMTRDFEALFKSRVRRLKAALAET